MTSTRNGQRSGHGADSALQHLADDATAAEVRRRRTRSAYTILVVDDHQPMLYATAKLLRAAGFNVLEAETGSAVLERGSDLSAVVLDVNLPDLNGIAVLQELRRTSRRRIPVILTSAVYVDEMHRNVGMDAGADAYLIAPLNHGALIATLDQLL